MYFYYQQFGGEEQWTAVPASHLPKLIEAQHPVLVTVLSVNALVEDLPGDQRDKLSYDGPFYVDWDGADIAAVIPKVHAFAEKLREMDVDLSMCQWYATGGKGFHCTVPAQIFMEKLPKSGTPNLPVIYKELVMSMYVDTIDLRVYSQGRGRMWRQPNVQRPNGRYKVQLTVDEVLNATEETIALLTSSPRPLFEPTPPQFTPKLAVAYARAAQKVEQALKTRGKRKRDPLVREKAASDSVMLMMAGYGLKPGVGFHEVALQITICATTAGMTEQEMLNACGPLIDGHVGDGNRYNTPQRRREELLRLYRYVNDNPMYDFSIGAVKSLLVHSAPDLDGIPVSKEDLRAGIDEAVADATDASAPEGSPGFKAPDEYNDVAGGVTLNKFGIYVATDEGNKRRICAISFEDIHLLMSMETGQLAAYEAEVLVNGRPSGRLTLEVETFQSPQMFNRFCARFGHAMQGTESHLRGAFMRFIELAKKKGKMLYIAKREGLDMVNIPNHEDTDLREPFMVWADGKGVIIDPRVRDKKLQVSFQGFPDPRGLFKTDIDDSPKLSAWLEDSSNREAMRQTLHNMLTCQKPDVLSKLVGWYTACFYRMLFHRAYNKFPVLHVNGAAGAGKCLAKGTPIIMADGRVLPVEEIKVGDYLLGPDGSPRRVLSLGRGRDTMYRVTQNKGMTYVVNSEHNLSLVFSDSRPRRLSDGRTLQPGEVAKINVKTFCSSPPSTRKGLKGWKPQALEFHRAPVKLLFDPYCLGAWLGDGRVTTPALCKPYCNMVQRWCEYAMELGCTVSNVNTEGYLCGVWLASGDRKGNPMLERLRAYSLTESKHIPEDYLYAPVQDRLALLAGLIDSDGNVNNSGFRYCTADLKLAQSVLFLAQSLGFRATLVTETKWHTQQQAERAAHLVYLSGDVERIPTLDKRAQPRRARDNWLLTGVQVEPLGEDDYYGFEIDGDHQFLLGDFTVTFNTEMNKTMAALFFYNQEPRMLTPQSSVFAIQQHLSASVSIPLILDEYKPHEMNTEMHNKLKLLIRDAYNARDINKGGGTRESDDYRVLSATQLAAPLVFIAEAAEEESAVAERVVLVTVVKPPSSISLQWLARYQHWDRNRKHLTILGKYLASEAINTMSIDNLRKEFDPLFEEARNRFMLTQADLGKDLDDRTLAEKQGAKERSVFNFTVARFGLGRFRRVVESIYGRQEFADIFQQMDDAVYSRMTDLQPATQAEWAKVMDSFATMTYGVDADSPYALRPTREYLVGRVAGREVVELAIQDCYLRYRQYMRTTGSRPLFAGVQTFLHSIKDSPALIKHGVGDLLQRPGVYQFDLGELQKLNVGSFKT